MISPIVFPSSFFGQMRICRYLVYGYLLGMQIWLAYATQQPLSGWTSVLVVLPSCVHTAMAINLDWAKRLHMVESVALPLTLWLAGYPEALMAAAFVALILCNALLWGGRSVPMLCTVFALGVSVAVVGTKYTSVPDVAGLALSAYGFVLVLVLAVASIAHSRTHTFMRGSIHLRRQNTDLRRYLPTDLVPGVDAHRQSERVWLTIVFIDLCGFTAAIDRLPAEATEEILNDFLAVVSKRISAANGVVHKFLGDGVLCVFRPDNASARGESAHRCIVSAQEVQDCLQALNQKWRTQGLLARFQVSVGVASGYCTLGDWGAADRLDYTVIGAPVNLASRLQDCAPPGGVLVDETTANLLSEIKTRALEPVQLKGLGLTKAYVPLLG